MNNKDYREKDVKGILFIQDGHSLFGAYRPCKVTVRMTSDDIGQSLSIQTADTMIQIPLEEVRDIIRVAEKE